MRSALIVLGGFAMLALFMVTGRALWGALGMSPAAHYFIPVWFVAAVVNLVIGMRHGYSFMEELPIFAMIFAVPALVALLLSWKLS